MSSLVQYIVVRTDLHLALQWPWGAIIAQACHASVAAIYENRDDVNVHQYLNNLENMRKIVVEVPDEGHLMEILRPKQSPYVAKPLGYRPLPRSILKSGPLRRLLKLNSFESRAVIKRIDFNKYRTSERGVRWHPTGGFYVQFNRRNYEKNFTVNAKVLFRPRYFGWEGAKRAAVQFRKRLQAEWNELEDQWKIIDQKAEIQRIRVQTLIRKRELSK